MVARISVGCPINSGLIAISWAAGRIISVSIWRLSNQLRTDRDFVGSSLAFLPSGLNEVAVPPLAFLASDAGHQDDAVAALLLVVPHELPQAPLFQPVVDEGVARRAGESPTQD